MAKEKEISKEAFTQLKAATKQDLFGNRKPVPFIVPYTKNCERSLAKAMGKSVVKTNVWRIAHVKSGKRWFKVFKTSKRKIMFVEGRDSEKWWTVSFSRAIDKHCKNTIIEKVMYAHPAFKGIINSEQYVKCTKVLLKLGLKWRDHVLSDKKIAGFTEEMIEDLKVKNIQERRLRRRRRMI